MGWLALIPFAVVVVLPLSIFGLQLLAHRRQHVTVEDGVVTVRSGFTQRAIPLAELGTAVSLKSVYDTSWSSLGPPASFGIWTWGGLIVLNRAGKVVAHLVDFPGRNSNVTLDEIPAPVHAYFNGPPRAARRRKAFLREYPRSLRPFQLWGDVRWAVALSLGIPAAVVVAVLVVVVVVAAVRTVAG